MKCTIIGGGGFIGSHLCEELIFHGHKVEVFDRKEAKYLDHVTSLGAQVFIGDFLNSNDLRKGISTCDVIYHLASTTVPKTSNDNFVFDVESNVIGTLNLLSEVTKKGIKKIVFPSSGGTVYGIPKEIPINEGHDTNPICSYGISKLCIEKYLKLFYSTYGLDYCVLRIANSYGERQPVTGSQGVISIFLREAITHKEIEVWGDGTQIRDYIYVKDIASAMVKAAAYDGEEKVLNIGTGKGHSLLDIVLFIKELINAPFEIKYLSKREFDVPINILDISLAEENLNWEPLISLREGIERIYKWMLITNLI